MDHQNNPISIVLFKSDSPFVAGFEAKIRERYWFEETSSIASDWVNATSVKVSNGVVEGFSDIAVRKFVWRDPLGERDLVVLTSDCSRHCQSDLRDLLNFACPTKTKQIITLTAVQNDELEADFRVSVACSTATLAAGLGSKAEVYSGNSLSGNSALLLPLAKELDVPAYCIVVECSRALDYVSSASVKSAVQTFSRITHVDLLRGELSVQEIRMRKHLKVMAEKRSQEYRNQSEMLELNSSAEDGDKPDSNDHDSDTRCIESVLRLAENRQWIEQLFKSISDGAKQVDLHRATFLESELQRLELYDQFEDRFLDLFRK